MPMDAMRMTISITTSREQLEALYRRRPTVRGVKEIDHITPHYRALIEAAPFFALATCGPEGLDCSPRGDAPGFVRVPTRRRCSIPDRRGNNRIDSCATSCATRASRCCS